MVCYSLPCCYLLLVIVLCTEFFSSRNYAVIGKLTLPSVQAFSGEFCVIRLTCWNCKHLCQYRKSFVASMNRRVFMYVPFGFYFDTCCLDAFCYCFVEFFKFLFCILVPCICHYLSVSWYMWFWLNYFCSLSRNCVVWLGSSSLNVCRNGGVSRIVGSPNRRYILKLAKAPIYDHCRIAFHCRCVQ